MAVFGVPFDSPEDSIHACNTALKMQESLIVMNTELKETGKKPIGIGIGISTGMVFLCVIHDLGTFW